ncbi:phosphoribosylformylglycinamidine synthase subunit PurQ [Enteractinococcus coprophilus]|uniref:Phosphoribosylformylglycinamidine synthase n=1 Tax=Enteractinococcus coprophilus TaxID=1027633 RepID=A0A543AG14_9MICC|nr:phosphoribosylformylglycinamidine synthase subunit PurQ [Enteractinococcus coprophilus]TQL71521.1 phosphoribosylformylglycinamidine synthase [Enteractinococcus coprophilus]
MSKPKIGVVMFDAATDAASVIRAVELAGGQPVKLHPKTTTAPDVADLRVVILPGGFSYGDYLRPGALAATQPIMSVLEDAVKAKELTVVGLGNGFQVLTEAGMLPGGFIANTTPGYHHAEVEFMVENTVSALTNAYEAADVIRLPQKAAFGSYTATETELEALEANGNVIVRSKDSSSGSARDIAGISSDDGLVLGLMANPEYAIEEGFGTDHPDGPGLGVDGQGLFISVVRAAGATNAEGVVGA